MQAAGRCLCCCVSAMIQLRAATESDPKRTLVPIDGRQSQPIWYIIEVDGHRLCMSAVGDGPESCVRYLQSLSPHARHTSSARGSVVTPVIFSEWASRILNRHKDDAS